MTDRVILLSSPFPPELSHTEPRLTWEIRPRPLSKRRGTTTPSNTDAGNASGGESSSGDPTKLPKVKLTLLVGGKRPGTFGTALSPIVEVKEPASPKAVTTRIPAPPQAVATRIPAPPQAVAAKIPAPPQAPEAAAGKREVEAQASTSQFLSIAQPAPMVPAVSAPLGAPLPGIALPQAQPTYQAVTRESAEAGFRQLLALSETDPASWEHLVGLYIQETERSPSMIAYRTIYGVGILDPVKELAKWDRDWRKVDEWEKNPSTADRWPLPMEGSNVTNLIPQFQDILCKHILEEAIRAWAGRCTFGFEGVMRRAGYMLKFEWYDNYMIMNTIKKMPEGPEKRAMIARARQESPRFTEQCMMDELCGIQTITKRRREDDGTVVEEQYAVYTTTNTRKERLVPPREEPPPKKVKMSAGRPTKFRGVPWEECAVDSKGNKLPWSLEWHPDHPNSRGQKRFVDEKGPFGKSMRRRSPRTVTPAKKENSTLDGFTAALQYDREKAAAEAQENGNVSRVHKEGTTTGSSAVKVPTQVSLYGFLPGTHWAAIDFYERASLGMICEDYDREPPIERRRIPNNFTAGQMVHSRPLTKEEAVLARQYHGGHCWIKVTFDSAEAADRAISYSPHVIQGHWVYAEPFQSPQPKHPDEPIPLREEDLNNGSYGGASPAPRVSKSLGPSSPQNNDRQTRSNSTLPRSFTSPSMAQADGQEARDITSQSSSTATSATATAPEHPEVRDPRQQLADQPGPDVVRRQHDPRFFTHFPDIPRTVLRPAHEAFLPQPTYMEALYQKFAAYRWFPGDVIGDGPPFLENGDFDWASAGFYWKTLYWLDSHLWTDFCGTKDKWT